jgi:cysteinyl-tRNA synthetase
MSKSIGNTVSPQEMIDAAGPRVVRYYLGQAHYRSVLDYRGTSLQEAAAAVARIDGFIAKASARVGAPGTPSVDDLPDAFGAAMDDDLNVPQALAVLHTTVRAGNTALAEGDDPAARLALTAVVAMTEVLGLDDAGRGAGTTGSGTSTEPASSAALDTLVGARIAERAEAKAARDWPRADAIRDSLAAAGIALQDGPDGVSWSLTDGQGGA